MIAMLIFVSSRFICTFLLKYFSPGGLLMTLAIGGFALINGVIFAKGITGLYCLVGVSACMSLMFPTIYGLNLGFMTLSSARVSFVLPLICFVVIAIFGFRTSKVHGHSY